MLRITKKEHYNVAGGAALGLGEGVGVGIFVCINVFRTVNYVKFLPNTYIVAKKAPRKYAYDL